MSCRKNAASSSEPPLQVEEINNANDPAQPVITVPPDNTLLPTNSSLNFMFDWEQASTMPVMPGTPAVPMPWSDQAIKLYDPGLRYDYKKSDGWEMVFNNFSTQSNYDHRIFLLYNKFRGLLRYYVYNPAPSNAAVDSYRSLLNELSLTSLGGIQSNLLNYAGQYIIDLDANNSTASLIEQWPLTLGGWYISQFEMAYDKAIAGYTFNQLGLQWNFSFARTEELIVNDKPAVDKRLFLQKEDVSIADDGTNGVPLTGNMQLQVKSGSGFDDLESIFSGTVINQLKQTITDPAAGNLLNASLVPALGIANCKLDVPATLRLDYNLVGFGYMSLAAPGMDHSKIVGFGPVFNEPLGVFYLASKPVIRHSKTSGALSDEYKLDVPSIEYVINPFVQNYADVRNFRQEIVAVDAEETKNLTEARLYRGNTLKASEPLKILGVRVAFEVVPKNGSGAVRIVKTFRANVVQ
jgi:hypothetical protein